jgi:hypothetical protein
VERPLFAGGYKGAKQDIFFGTQQMGAKNGKGVESESLRELKAMQARGERQREGAEDEVLVGKGVAERRTLGVHELVLA